MGLCVFPYNTVSTREEPEKSTKIPVEPGKNGVGNVPSTGSGQAFCCLPIAPFPRGQTMEPFAHYSYHCGLLLPQVPQPFQHLLLQLHQTLFNLPQSLLFR